MKEFSSIGTASAAPILITAFAIDTNVLTFTADNDLDTGGGQDITVSGFATSTFLNGVYTVTSATSTEIVVPLTHGDTTGTEDGQAVLTPQALTAGLPLTYAFTNAQGKAIQLPLGSGAAANWMEVISAVGGAYNYKVDLTVSPQTLKIYNGVTALTDGDDITPDTIWYRAEFNYGMGGSGY